ncbi:MAG: serine/threonine protein phosphatase [Alphaproteobacteria bacterium]|nr:serine/threonine protein phosphatase [Alphaproteobacteria bacterium]MDX5368427.1 serine/threonine protein phosphatase [Alphaproteobacteria bacterium]MDX5463222.1 serine/threonine protein phosphatase [Alphaproteobacteria bacterium]
MGDMVLSRLKSYLDAESAWPRAPGETVIYAVGDVHGRADLMDALTDRIRRDAERREADRRLLVFLGDYIDRGEDSRGVIDRLTGDPPDGFERVCLRGNHEEVLLAFLEDSSGGPAWCRFGGLETLMSYGVLAPDAPAPRTAADFEALRRALTAALPQAHRAFLENLPAWHEEGDYLFVHAGVRPGVPLDAQTERDLTWIRDAFLAHREPFERFVVHGHTPSERPQIKPNRMGVDTGAYLTGRLTAAVLHADKRTTLST